MSRSDLVWLSVKYALFAAVATLTNIITQAIVSRVYVGFGNYLVALGAGTLVGLVVKYILDKRYIFYFKTKNASEDGRKFILYASMGILTTAIFWGMQTLFFVIGGTETAKFAGAVIGLSIGYFTKYLLDRKFVFVYVA